MILNNIEESYVLLDKDLIILQSNRAAREGIWSKAGMFLFPGINVLESIDEERIPKLKEIFADVLAGKTRITEYIYQLDNKTFYFENVMLPARNSLNEIVGIIIYSKEITEKKLAENALKEAEERWQFAFEASRQGAWDWNLTTKEVIYSTSYKKLYGFTDDELNNDLKEWNLRIHPEDKKN